MLNSFKDSLTKIYQQVTDKLSLLFNRSEVDESIFSELEKILIQSDAGVHTTRALISQLRIEARQGIVQTGAELEKRLSALLKTLLSQIRYNQDAEVFLMVGINGSGKTTCAAKLGYQLKQEGKKVLFIAADTFRAGASEQLKIWADVAGGDILIGTSNQEPASLIFEGTQTYKRGSYDALIIDTAGRLQSKIHLMKELEKMHKILIKQLPDAKIATLLTIDAMLGQNSFDQAEIFKESTQVSGIVLTKMDGTAKGGIVLAIMQHLQIPIAYVSFGEKIDQISLFDPSVYINELLGAQNR